jgi:type VI secretion system secreted protein Hcp
MTLRRVLVSSAVLLVGLALAAPAYAELNAYLKIKAAKQGAIKGGVTQKGREDSILVIAVDHELVSPRDSASGQATGKRQHKPIVITKEIDRSSPALRTALITGENLPEVTLQFHAPQRAATGGGAETQHFTIALKNARIAGIHHVMPNNKDPQLTKLAAYEQVSFVYDEITWTWTDGGLTASDSWGGGAR